MKAHDLERAQRRIEWLKQVKTARDNMHIGNIDTQGFYDIKIRMTDRNQNNHEISLFKQEYEPLLSALQEILGERIESLEAELAGMGVEA